MARREFTFTFTNAQPGAEVWFGDKPVYSSASDTTVDGPQLVLDDENTVVVWSDAATLTAYTKDGRGETISATATASSTTVSTDQGTAGTSPFATGAFQAFKAQAAGLTATTGSGVNVTFDEGTAGGVTTADDDVSFAAGVYLVTIQADVTTDDVGIVQVDAAFAGLVTDGNPEPVAAATHRFTLSGLVVSDPGDALVTGSVYLYADAAITDATVTLTVARLGDVPDDYLIVAP